MVTFYGRDLAGNDVTASGSIGVNFGDFPPWAGCREFVITTNRYRRSGSGRRHVALLDTACTVDKSGDADGQRAFGVRPDHAGIASPDILPRDGQSTSILRITVRTIRATDAGQRLNVSQRGS